MSGKRAVVALIAALLAFGYVFTLNPNLVEFQIYPGAAVRTSFALILFLFFLAGFGAAVLASAFREAARSFSFWRHRKSDERHAEARRLMIEGRNNAVLGKTKLAHKLLTKAYRKTGGESLIGLEMARVEIADGRNEAAERRLKNLLQDSPGSPEVLSLLLDIYRARGDFEGQVTCLTRWLDADPENPFAVRSLRDVYARAGNWAEAVRLQEKVLAQADGREARNQERRRLAELRYRHAMGLPAASARPALEKLVRDHDEFAPAHAALGRALAEAGDTEAAVQAWLRGYQSTGQAGLLLLVEKVRLDAGKDEEMLKLYRKLSKRSDLAGLLRVRLLLNLERSTEALEAAEKAQAGEDAGRQRWRQLLRGEALYRLRSYDGAAEAFRRSVLGGEGAFPLPFVCDACKLAVDRWEPACPGCHRVDSLRVEPQILAAPAALPAKT